MKRIGIAASKMAKGNIVAYNSYVIILSFLFSLLLFFIAGTPVMLALIIIETIAASLSANMTQDWNSVICLCMVSLTIVVGLINIFAVIKNIRFRFPLRKENQAA